MATSLHHRSRLRAFTIGICIVGALALNGCGDDETSTTVPAAEVAIDGQWARTSPAMASAGAMYVTITSASDDKLVAATVDSSIATTLELHETVMAMGSATTVAMGGGEMTMRPVEFVELPAGVAVELKPGGYHIMMLNLVKPLELGTTIQVTLVFENAGEVTIDVPVLDEAP